MQDYLCTFDDVAIKAWCTKQNIEPQTAPAKYNFSTNSGPKTLPIWKIIINMKLADRKFNLNKQLNGKPWKAVDCL